MDDTNDRPEEGDKYDENAEQNSPSKKIYDKSKENINKISIAWHATGNTPIMKRKRWHVKPEDTVGHVLTTVRRYLKINASESLFLYVNQAFAPSPDQMIGNLYDCYGAEGLLNIHYSLTQAWG